MARCLPWCPLRIDSQALLVGLHVWAASMQCMKSGIGLLNLVYRAVIFSCLIRCSCRRAKWRILSSTISLLWSYIIAASSWKGKRVTGGMGSSVASPAKRSHALCNWCRSVLCLVWPRIQITSSGQFGGRFSMAWKNRFQRPRALRWHLALVVLGGSVDPMTTDWLSRKQYTGVLCVAFSAAVTSAMSSDL